MLLTKKQLQYHVAPKDDTRKGILQLYVTTNGNVVSTNGRALLIAKRNIDNYSIRADEIMAEDGESATIPTNIAKQIVDMAKFKGDEPHKNIIFINSAEESKTFNATVKSVYNECIKTLNYKPYEEKFPNYEQVMLNEKKAVCTIDFNVENLVELLNTINNLEKGTSNDKIQMFLFGRGREILLKTLNTEAIIMPMNGGIKGDVEELAGVNNATD